MFFPYMPSDQDLSVIRRLRGCLPLKTEHEEAIKYMAVQEGHLVVTNGRVAARVRLSDLDPSFISEPGSYDLVRLTTRRMAVIPAPESVPVYPGGVGNIFGKVGSNSTWEFDGPVGHDGSVERAEVFYHIRSKGPRLNPRLLQGVFDGLDRSYRVVVSGSGEFDPVLFRVGLRNKQDGLTLDVVAMPFKPTQVTWRKEQAPTADPS